MEEFYQSAYGWVGLTILLSSRNRDLYPLLRDVGVNTIKL